MKQLIYDSQNGEPHRLFLVQPYILWTGTQVPWNAQWLGAGLYGLESNPRMKSTVDCGHEGGDCAGECLWRKTEQPRGQGDTADSHKQVEPSL